jgi:hypothetical protein
MSAQSMAALSVAQERRLARAAFRRELVEAGESASRRRVGALLQSDETPAELRSIAIATLVASIPRYGVERTRRALAAASWLLGHGAVLRENRVLGSLTVREREALADALKAVL